jgi:hypothetical protein
MRRIPRAYVALPLAVLALATVPAASRAGDPAPVPAPADELSVADQTTAVDLLRGVARLTGRRIYWSADDKYVQSKRLQFAEPLRIAKAQAFEAVRALLVSQEIVLVPTSGGGVDAWMAISARELQSQVVLRMKPVPVALDAERVADLERQDGLFVSAAIPVRHPEGIREMRTALQRLVTSNNIGSVQEVTASGVLVVTDYAPNVAAIWRVVQEMDARPAHDTASVEYHALRHAAASDVASVLRGVFAPPRAAAPPNAPAPVDPNELRIVADPWSNQVVVTGLADEMASVRRAIEKLDRPRTVPGETPPGDAGR